MITFQRTDDLELVRLIITTPRIYRMASDDGSPAPENFKPINDPAVWYVIVNDGDELLGLFAFYPQNSVTWQVHTCLLPNAIKVEGRAVDAARALRFWMWENSPCLRITTKVPTFNRLALNFAKAAGMLEFGVDVMSFLKGGKLYDEVMLGVSKSMEGT